MSDPDRPPRRPVVPGPPSLPELDTPPREDVLDDVPSTEEVVENAQTADEIVSEQPDVDELLGRHRRSR